MRIGNLLRSEASLSYGPSYEDMHKRAAIYVDKILKGAKPAGERTRFGEASQIMYGWQASRRGKLQERHSMSEEDWIVDDIKRLNLGALDL